MRMAVLHTVKRQNLNSGPLDFERDASINDVPFEGWNLGFMSVPHAHDEINAHTSPPPDANSLDTSDR